VSRCAIARRRIRRRRQSTARPRRRRQWRHCLWSPKELAARARAAPSAWPRCSAPRSPHRRRRPSPRQRVEAGPETPSSVFRGRRSSGRNPSSAVSRPQSSAQASRLQADAMSRRSAATAAASAAASGTQAPSACAATDWSAKSSPSTAAATASSSLRSAPTSCRAPSSADRRGSARRTRGIRPLIGIGLPVTSRARG